ncbi:MAG TPA: DUF6502 family protein [Sulfuricaulis sp.]|nr:DUF6502 family protein [Sulfuricaulis sp.]
MDASSKQQQVIADAILRLMRPLVRVLLRNGVSFHGFADLAKRVYVEVATQEDLTIPGRKPTVSRVAVLTGLTRKEVQRISALPGTPDPEAGERYNRAARVVSGWVRDPDFSDADGEPLALTPDEGASSFAELVRRYSGDVPPRAVLDELLRVGTVERGEDGRIRLFARSYIPRTSDADKFAILGTDVSDLIATIDHNMRQGAADPRFQRKVMYDNLPAEVIPKFRKLGAARAQALLEQMDKWLSQHDRDVQQTVDGSGRMRAGIGIYYFEEDMNRLTEEKET